jgi:hypothetical protein
MHTSWPFWLAGLAIGAFVPLFALLTGKALGISSGYAEMCSLARPAGSERWKLWFVLGIPLGGFVSTVLTGAPEIATTSAAMRDALGLDGGAQLALLAFGGVLIGYGANLAGGCTSGHSIVGIALGAKSSLIATVGFMIGGFAVTWLIVLLQGGIR